MQPLPPPIPLPMRHFMVVTQDGSTQDAHGNDVNNLQVLWYGDALSPEDALKECAKAWIQEDEDEADQPFDDAEVYEIPFPPISGSLYAYFTG